MKAKEFIIELKKQSKPRNFVAKNASLAGKAGQHKDKKKAEKQGDVKHKNKEYAEGTADEGVLSFLKTEPKKKWDPTKDSRATSNKNNDDSWVKLLIDKHRRGIPLTDREWNSIEQWKLKRAMRGEAAEIQELSTGKLALYKKAAGADAKKADADGDYARGDKRFKGINRATNKQFDNDLKKHDQKDVAERARDPEDWDEGNTEPPNNFAVYINGKKWKVFKGRGRYADDQREQAHYQQLKDWAAKKSASTGKQWTVSITGETATESVEETSNMPFAGAKIGHKEGPAGQWRNDGTKKNKPAKPGDLVGDGM